MSTDSYRYLIDEFNNTDKIKTRLRPLWGAENLAVTSQYSGCQRIRKVVANGSIVEERIYLGSYEIYRKFVSSSLTLKRTTVHVIDDTGRIAMLQVRTVGTDPSPATLVRYIYSNHLSTASLELDDTAAIISYEEYHPYGTTSYQAANATINATAKRYRYTGKERDEETGLYYHGARYYCPWLARWCAADPINNEWYNAVNGQPGRNHEWQFVELTASSYEYCYANPVRFTDPIGEQPIGGIGRIIVSYPPGSVPSSRPRPSAPSLTPQASTATELLETTQMQVTQSLNSPNSNIGRMRGAVGAIIKNYKLDSIAPLFEITLMPTEAAHTHFETVDKLASQNRREYVTQSTEISLGDFSFAQNHGLGDLIIGITHEYIHGFQRGVAHSPSKHEEREFFANQFSALPNASIVAREHIIDFHGIAFPEPTARLGALVSANALRFYGTEIDNKGNIAVTDEFREKYRQDAINLANKFYESYNDLPENLKNSVYFTDLKQQTNNIVEKYNLH